MDVKLVMGTFQKDIWVSILHRYLFSSILPITSEKLHAKKLWFWETGISSWRNENNQRKIRFSFFTLAEWCKRKMLHWLTMWHCVRMRPGMMWQCGGVLCTNNYSLPSGNEEYYTTAPQCETLHSGMLHWFTYFVASHVRRRSVFLPSTEYRINIEL